jgi:hypothetical protein
LTFAPSKLPAADARGDQLLAAGRPRGTRRVLRPRRRTHSVLYLTIEPVARHYWFQPTTPSSPLVVDTSFEAPIDLAMLHHFLSQVGVDRGLWICVRYVPKLSGFVVLCDWRFH